MNFVGQCKSLWEDTSVLQLNTYRFVAIVSRERVETEVHKKNESLYWPGPLTNFSSLNLKFTVDFFL